MEVSLREKFGQMIMIGLDIDDVNDEIVRLIRDFKIGGVVLYKKNYHDISSMIGVINQLKEINVNNKPLFIAIDQENGRVNRLPNDISRIYNPKRQVATGKMEIIDKCNEITSKILSSVGVNMNFAPVLDVNRDINNKIIGNRSYGTNKEEVIKYGIPVMKKLNDSGIVAVVKHFPGHGLVNEDSHFLIPTINDIKKMEDDLEIYEHAIKNGSDAIMIGHLRVKGYGRKPATINKKIIDKYLVNRFNYKGLIITDDLRMNTMKYIYGVRNLVNYSISAGCNVLMIKYKKGDIKRIYNDIYKMIDKGKIPSDMINNSYDKIMAIKDKYKLNNDLICSSVEVDKINKEIELVNSMM